MPDAKPHYTTVIPHDDVPRTVSITDRLNLDLDNDGRVLGVESIEGPITQADLRAVIAELRHPLPAALRRLQAVADAMGPPDEIERLSKALQVCEVAVHTGRVVADDADEALLHAAQQASGAWCTDWRPEYVADDLPDFRFLTVEEAEQRRSAALCDNPTCGCTAVRELTPEEQRAQIDEEARRVLGITGEEFAAAWRAGHYRDDPNPRVTSLAMLLPDAW